MEKMCEGWYGWVVFALWMGVVQNTQICGTASYQKKTSKKTWKKWKFKKMVMMMMRGRQFTYLKHYMNSGSTSLWRSICRQSCYTQETVEVIYRNYPVLAFFVQMGGASALVQLPLNRWRFSRDFGVSHILQSSVVFEFWGKWGKICPPCY